MAGCAVVAIGGTAIAGAASAQPTTHQYAIRAEDLGTALRAFAMVSGKDVVFDPALVRGKPTNGARGTLDDETALSQLLAGSGLSFDRTGVGGFVVRAPGPQDQGASAGERPSTVSEVTITGSNIRGVAPVGSPVQSYTQAQIQAMGATTTEELIDRIPQNFNSLRAGASHATSSTINGAPNDLAVNGVDLRGLGVGTTLILLNGRRLAPSSSGTTPDISLIPLANLARVDILPDGASAIYGSDAVGGVVNFIFNDHYEGAETSAGFGAVSDGHHSSANISQVVGHDWGSGSILASAGYSEQTPLNARDRVYSRAAGDYTLIQNYHRENTYVSARQDLSEILSTFADIMYSAEQSRFHSVFDSAFSTGDLTARNHKDNTFGLLGADIKLPKSLNLEISGTYSRATESEKSLFLYKGNPADFVDDDLHRASSDYDVSVKLDGPFADFPAGAAKFAIGGGVTGDSFWYTDKNNASLTSAKLKRHTEYGFGEIYMPLISSDQNVPFVQKLEVTVAGRFTHYSDFGSNFSPKMSTQWTVFQGMKFRASYSESFKAPFLYQLNQSNVQWLLLPMTNFKAATAYFGLPPTANILGVAGNNPSVGPEKANTLSAGMDLAPAFVPGLHISATYYHISYNDKITSIPEITAVLNPALYASYFNLHPSAAQIAQFLAADHLIRVPGVDGANVTSVLNATSLLLDAREMNAAKTTTSGLDLSASFERGPFNIGTDATWIFNYTSKADKASIPIAMLNIPAAPVGFRDRSWLGYARGQWSGQLSMNYVRGYTNIYDTTNSHIHPWTTFDLNVNYSFDGDEALLKGLRASLSVQNLFNADPPFVSVSNAGLKGVVEPIGFDPTNANPLGRFVALQLTKKW